MQSLERKLKKQLLQKHRPGRRQFVQRNAGKSGPIEKVYLNGSNGTEQKEMGVQ